MIPNSIISDPTRNLRLDHSLPLNKTSNSQFACIVPETKRKPAIESIGDKEDVIRIIAKSMDTIQI